MNNWPRGELERELLNLVRVSRQGATDSPPLKFLPQCGALLATTPAVLLTDSGNERARVDAMASLLEVVTYRAVSSKKEIKAFGDLLGLADRSEDEIRNIYDRFHGRGKPKKFTRHGLQVRRILAGHRFGGTDTKSGLGIETIKKKEEDLARAFVGELRTYLSDEDGKLTSLVQELKSPAGTEVEKAESAVPAGLPRSGESKYQIFVESYVGRPRLEQQFNILVEHGVKLIVLIGFAGMGKTRLTKRLAPDAPLIKFVTGRPNLSHLQAALERYNLHRQVTVTAKNAAALLAVLLTAESGPQFVVLDNLQSTGELQKWVPPDTSATIIATCRESIDGAPSWAAEIIVDVMEPSEAERLAKMWQPRISDEDATLVAKTLGRYRH